MAVTQRRIVAAYIVSKDGKLLLGRKDPARGGVYPDCWHTPGGGVEAGETDEEALVREVREETGLGISNSQVKLIDTKGSSQTVKHKPGQPDQLIEMHFYIYRVTLPLEAASAALAPFDDLVELTWFSLDQLNEITLTPPSDDLFARIGTGWLTSREGA